MLAYRVGGQGPPLTFLHGFTQRGDSWDELIGLLSPRWRWITVDLPGHGDSPDHGATMPDAGDSLLDIWDSLEVRRSHLVGYSLGGRLALWLAAHHPDRLLSLVTIGAHAGFEGQVRRRRLAEDRALAARIETDGIEWFAADWGARPLFAGLARRGPAFVDRIQASRRRNRAGGLAASLRGMGGGATAPFWDDLGAIDVPALLVAGAEDDRYVEAARRLARHIPRASASVVPFAGHAAHLEQPLEFARVLADHLSTL